MRVAADDVGAGLVADAESENAECRIFVVLDVHTQDDFIVELDRADGPALAIEELYVSNTRGACPVPKQTDPLVEIRVRPKRHRSRPVVARPRTAGGL